MYARTGRFVLGMAAVVALAVGPAFADFSMGGLNDFVETVNGIDTRGDKKQDKAVVKINKFAAKDADSFSKELKFFAKIAKTSEKALGSQEDVMSDLETLCNMASLNSIFWQVQNGEGGLAAATVAALPQGTKGAKAVAKAGVALGKAQNATDCSKKIKFLSKVQKAAEKMLQKWGT